jgi:hypothetical protein
VINSNCQPIRGCEFQAQNSLREIVFSSPSQVEKINGFNECISLYRIEIPSSVLTLGGLNSCPSLNDIIFASHSCIKEITGCDRCTSLYRIEIPSSVKYVSGLNHCTSLNDIIFHHMAPSNRLLALMDAHHFVESEFHHQLKLQVV